MCSPEFEINLSPLDENGNCFGMEGSTGSPLKNLDKSSALAIFKTPFSMGVPNSNKVVSEHVVSPRKPTVGALEKLKHPFFQAKMRVLIKNPVIFNQFQRRLSENDEKAHSKEGLTVLLYRFLDEDLRVPELRDEIVHAQKRIFNY